LPRAGAEIVKPELQNEEGLRADVVGACDVSAAVLAQAPEAAPPFFRVPRVIER
jgi:Asp-tRNA(Asn)/Glu-tRNA(Gln) amidotransferase C subunit